MEVIVVQGAGRAGGGLHNRTTMKAVSFDCAQTLVDVDWQPGRFAVACAEAVGLQLDQQVGAEVYDRLLQGRWREYALLNQSRDPELLERFWLMTTSEWLERMELAADPNALVAQANELMYGPGSIVYRVFDDVLPCLDQLRGEGVRMIVVSNWDASLHRVLRSFGLSDYFEVVVASMEEGWEKPDPKLFEAALSRSGLGPEDVLHVGDNPVDDLLGAHRAGIRSALIDRSLTETNGSQLATLADLPSLLSVMRA